MKKLSFFLMAMLFSVMSFAAESLLVTLDFSKNTWGLPVASANKTTATVNYTSGDYTITLAGGGSGNGHYYNNDGYLMLGKSGATLTLPAFDFKTTKIVVTGRNGASTSVLQNIYVGSTAVSTQTKGAAVTNTYAIAEDYQAAGNVYVLKVSSSHNTQIVKMEIYGEEGGEQGEKVDAPKFSVTETNFKEAFDLTISSAEGTTLKYTTDNTDPKTSATAVSVETNTANVAIPAKSTVVKAVAVKGDLVSVVASTIYAYVNSPETAYTVAEAMEVIDAGLGLENELYVKGEISKIEKFDANYESITYWIKDEEDNKFECYSGLGLNKAKFTSIDDLVVGSKVVVCGTMKKYNTTYEFNYNNYIVSLTLPSYTVTATAENGSVEGLAADGKYEHGAEVTLTANPESGYKFVNWTSDETVVSTENPYKFTVTADVALVANFIKKTISYELNGGAFPEVKVPTNEELALVFKQEYAEYFAIEGLTDTDMKREVGNFIYVTNSKGGDAIKFITENANWKWLHDYILTVAGNIPEETNVGFYWRANLDGFFHCKNAVAVGGVASADYTVAGKPEAWGAAYQAAHAVVLPTEPVDAPYTLPTPVKEGYKFVGWYDNAEGTGEPMTVIPAGWDGTLYAIWVEIYTITVEAENGTVEGAGNYEHGAEATLTATAAEGYEFTCWTSGEDTVSTANPYKFTVTADVALVANFKEVEPEIEWMKMDLEITNLVTEVMEVGGAKFLQLMGRDDMNDADVTLFLNNYADVDDDYVVNAESSYMTFGGMELTVLEGTMTQTSETAKGTIYKGTVRTYAAEEERYVEFALTMYAAPVTVLVLTDAIVAINEKLGTLTFDVATGEDEGYYVELANYTAPGVHEGPQICLLETPEVVAYATYVETEVVDGVITLKGEFTSPMGPKFDLTISGKLPGSATALDNLNTTVAPVKMIENGQLIIINNGVQFNAQGQVIK